MLSLLFEVQELGINSFPSTRLLMKNAEQKARMGEGAAVAIPFDMHYNNQCLGVIHFSLPLDSDKT